MSEGGHNGVGEVEGPSPFHFPLHFPTSSSPPPHICLTIVDGGGNVQTSLMGGGSSGKKRRRRVRQHLEVPATRKEEEFAN